MYYFAYGSCMDKKSFKNTVNPIHFRIVGPAVLRDHTLAFTLYSDHREGGVADVVSLKGDYVEGVLYELQPEALVPLDEREGVSRGAYERKEIRVECNNERLEAMTYMVVNKSCTEIAPSKGYAQLIYNGARDYLSFAYRKKLIRSWETKFGIRYFHKSEQING